MEKEQIILLCVAGAALVAVVVAFFVGVAYRKKTAESKIGSAELEAEKIKKEAATEAQRAKKEAIIEAKDELHRLRTEQERELKERRNEVTHQERRLQQKEENLDKKTENLEKKEEFLQGKIKDVEEKLAETETIKKSQLEMLERISGLSKEQAKEMIANASFIMLMGGDPFKQKDMCERLGILEDIKRFKESFKKEEKTKKLK